MFKYLRVGIDRGVTGEVFHVTSREKSTLPQDVEICGFNPDQCLDDYILEGVLETEDLVVVRGTATILGNFPIDTYTDYNVFNVFGGGERFVDAVAMMKRVPSLSSPITELRKAILSQLRNKLASNSFNEGTQEYTLCKKYLSMDDEYFMETGSLGVTTDELQKWFLEFHIETQPLVEDFIENIYIPLLRQVPRERGMGTSHNEIVFKNIINPVIMSIEDCRKLFR